MLFPDFSVWGVTFCVSCNFEKLILGRFKSEELSLALWGVPHLLEFSIEVLDTRVSGHDDYDD